MKARLVTGLLALGAAACGGPQSMLDPRGPGAARVVELWWVMFALGAAVMVAVLAFTAWAVVRPRRGERRLGDTGARRLIIGGGVIVPTLILFPILAYSVFTTSRVHPLDGNPGLRIEVTGHQFWWEVRYPEHGIVTANEIHIPTGERVHFDLVSADVIHSFWVPKLHGKIDTTPGRRNELVLQADEPGVYRGQCAEFCGVQHANMFFLVIAQPPGEFEAWLQRRAEPPAEPTEELALEGREIFLTSSCVGCHAIEGTPATERVGPDLTDLATRRTIGAGMLPNTRGNLAGWIMDAQAIKPGNLMPPTELDPQELQAVLAYLETLR